MCYFIRVQGASFWVWDRKGGTRTFLLHKEVERDHIFGGLVKSRRKSLPKRNHKFKKSTGISHSDLQCVAPFLLLKCTQSLKLRHKICHVSGHLKKSSYVPVPLHLPLFPHPYDGQFTPDEGQAVGRLKLPLLLLNLGKHHSALSPELTSDSCSTS